MRDWEKLARACRRYLDAYNDEIADDITLGSVGNDLRIIAIREVQAAPRVFFPGDMVPAGISLITKHGDVLAARATPYRITGGPAAAYIEVSLPSLEERQSTVDRARAEREAKHDG